MSTHQTSHTFTYLDYLRQTAEGVFSLAETQMLHTYKTEMFEILFLTGLTVLQQR